MSLVMIKTATALVHIYMGNTTLLRMWSAKTEKKALLEEKEESWKNSFKGEKKIRKRCQTATKETKTSLQKSLASLALLFLSLNTRNTFKEHNKIMIGNYLSTMLVCVFAYLYPLFLCFKVRERTI
jgi:hypothetical protein